MSITIAELNGRVFVDLEMAGEYCFADDVHRAVVRRTDLRMSQARSGSDANVLLKTSANFTPSGLSHDISALIGNGHPAWIEMQTNATEWLPIRIVNLSQLNDYVAGGVLACAFWAEDTAVIGAEAVQYVSFSFQPSGACRIKYDLDSVRSTLADIIAMPDHVADLIVLEAENVLIQKQIKPRLALDLQRNGELRKDLKVIMDALSGIYQQNLLDIPDLRQLWKIWAFRDRSVQTSFMKPTPSGRGLYGDGFSY